MKKNFTTKNKNNLPALELQEFSKEFWSSMRADQGLTAKSHEVSKPRDWML